MSTPSSAQLTPSNSDPESQEFDIIQLPLQNKLSNTDSMNDLEHQIPSESDDQSPILPREIPDSSSTFNPPQRNRSKRRISRFTLIYKFLPMLFVFGLMFQTTIGYINIQNIVAKETNFSYVPLFIHFVLLVPWTISYVRCVVQNPGFVPESPYPNLQLDSTIPIPYKEDFEDHRALVAARRRYLQQFPFGSKWCSKCKAVKPPRCSHDSITGHCVQRFDHMCPWVANAVGYGNHKYFVLFLVYTEIMGLLMVSVLFAEYTSLGFNIIIQSASGLLAFVMSLSFSVVLLFFGGLHVVMVKSNQTSIEVGYPVSLRHFLQDALAGDVSTEGLSVLHIIQEQEQNLESDDSVDILDYEENCYNLSTLDNIKQIMGHGGPLMWMMPFFAGSRPPYDPSVVRGYSKSLKEWILHHPKPIPFDQLVPPNI